MKKSKILQLNNAFIQSERKKLSINWQNANKKSFYGCNSHSSYLSFMLPAYNLVGTYTNIQQQEKKLAELEKITKN